jgi:hypothetical protein
MRVEQRKPGKASKQPRRKKEKAASHFAYIVATIMQR